jgi:glycosyltransferase involved in cell wall biosynthesis
VPRYDRLVAKLAFVAPRYGPRVLGGAEAQVRDAARGLAGRGHQVEVLTTCAENHHTWENVLEPGVETEDGVTVRRFLTVPRSDPVLWAALEKKMQVGAALSLSDELSWVNSRLMVPDLYFHLAGQADSYDAIVYSPYLFWTTLYCLPIAPERSILIPCLHDEAYAYMRTVRAALAGAAGVWFLSEPEHQLAHRLAPLPAHTVTGSAVHVPESYDPDGFRERHELERPFVLYAGRREGGKGWPEAMAGFGAAVVRHGLQLDLVTVGVGEPEIPTLLEKRVIDLGYLPDAEVGNAFAAASAYLQPSRNESFSRTVMEAWLASTPVIATMESAVVSWHIERSGGGFVYGDEIELGECLRTVAEQPKAMEALAAAGRDYVLANYQWEDVLDRMEAALEAFA